MKTVTKFVLILCLAPFTAYAFDGHNGISFDMTQQEVEKKGFVCSPPKEKNPSIKAECEHMDLTGVAFGYPTKDYSLIIGPSGKVDNINANFGGHISIEDYLGLHRKIEHFFPEKNEKASFHAQGTATRDEWRDKTNASAVLLLFYGTPPITKTRLSISFWSPRYMSIIDKKNK